MSDDVRRIADAVLYEGYMLWPYRRSAIKNRRRWTFGAVHPPGWSAAHPDDPAELRAACLVRGAGASVAVHVRFLQVVTRGLRDLNGQAVDCLEVGGERLLAWEEATEREAAAPPLRAGEQAEVAIQIAAGTATEPVAGGAIVRSWEAVDGSLAVAAHPLASDLARVEVEIANATPWPPGGDREDALRRALVSTHAVLRATGGAFVSATDPPAELRDAAAGCEQRGLWPVLAGAGDVMLAAPIILPDHPQLAPESPGDLFDATEIDGLLTLSILGLSDAEQAEMRASDPRAREILERTAGLSPERVARLHGAVREMRPAVDL